MEKLEHKLIVMREINEDHQTLHSINNNNTTTSSTTTTLSTTTTTDYNNDTTSQNKNANNCLNNTNSNNNNNTKNTSNNSTDINNSSNNNSNVAGELEQDPFYDSQENHNLIGVSNIFLECLFNDVKLNYHVPIISQQAEVAGRLQVQAERG